MEEEVEEGLFVDVRGGEEGVYDLAQGEEEVESGEGEGGEDEERAVSAWRGCREGKVGEDKVEERTIGVLSCVNLVGC